MAIAEQKIGNEWRNLFYFVGFINSFYIAAFLPPLLNPATNADSKSWGIAFFLLYGGCIGVVNIICMVMYLTGNKKIAVSQLMKFLGIIILQVSLITLVIFLLPFVFSLFS